MPSVMRMGGTHACSVVVSAEPGVRAGFNSGGDSVSRYKSTPDGFNTVISRFGPGFGGVRLAPAPPLNCISEVVIRCEDPAPLPPPSGATPRAKVPQTPAGGEMNARMGILRYRNDSASTARPLPSRIPARPL